MAIIDVESRIKSSATLIGEEEGDHDDDRETLNKASKNKTIPDCEIKKAHRERIIPS